MTKEKLHWLAAVSFTLLCSALLISVVLYSPPIQLNNLEEFLLYLFSVLFLILFSFAIVVLNRQIASAESTRYLLIYPLLSTAAAAIWIRDVIVAQTLLVALPFIVIVVWGLCNLKFSPFR